jgi:NADPH-dependent ferric siderophore reductase
VRSCARAGHELTIDKDADQPADHLPPAPIRTSARSFQSTDAARESWLASATIGEQLFLVGPRSALDLDAVNRPMIFFGDETSFGTAAAIRATPEGMREVAFSFEVESEEASRIALERIGVTNGVTLTTREPQDRHLDRIESDLTRALRAAPQTRCVFTGKASSIQRLYKAVRRAGISAKQVTNVAYWAPATHCSVPPQVPHAPPRVPQPSA